MDQDKQKSNLVIDLKRLAEERASTAEVTEEIKNNISQKEGRIFISAKSKDAKMGVNFLDDESLYESEDYQEKTEFSSSFDPESAKSLGRIFSSAGSRRHGKNSAIGIVLSLFYKPVWLCLFLIRFIYFLFAKIIVQALRKIKILSRPEFGKPESLKRASFFRNLRGAAKKADNPILLNKNEDNNLAQDKVLFSEFTKKEVNPARQALGFAFLVLVLVLPFKAFSYYQNIKADNLKGRVMGAAEEAINSLQEAGGSITDKEMINASLNFSRASDSFRQAREQIEAIDGIVFKLAKFAPSEEAKLASVSREILTIGELASSLGTNLSIAFDGFIDEDSNSGLDSTIDRFLKYEKKALGDASKIKAIISEIDPLVFPEEYREAFILLKEKAIDLEATLEEIAVLVEKLKIFLGFENDKRYLFLFQNNNEVRATGGFIGSFALVDFSKGKIKNITIPGGGSYETEGTLYEKIISPSPLHLVDPLWHFWDANWWPDWEKSAKKLAWFYEKSGGSTVDGCISLTPTVLERILRVTGPIDMSENYGLVMDADNFWINIRDIIENEKLEDQQVASDIAENKPKKIIGEFFEKLMKEVPNYLNKDSMAKFLNIAERSLEEKQALFYFRDESLQDEAIKRGWAGKVEETNKDYLMVVNTNIAGGKSDKRMVQVLDHEVEILPDGSIVDTLRIKRTHTGAEDEPYHGVRNVNWMRIYVPEGSELLEAAGFRGPDSVYFEEPEADWEEDPDVLAEESEMVVKRDCQNTYVYQDSGKTVFANWSMVDPGQTREIYLKYRLPFRVEDKEAGLQAESKFEEVFNKVMNVEKKALYPYSIFIQKQSGSRFTTINSQVKLPDNLTVIWNYPQALEAMNSGWKMKDELNEDKYWALIMEKI